MVVCTVYITFADFDSQPVFVSILPTWAGNGQDQQVLRVEVAAVSRLTTTKARGLAEVVAQAEIAAEIGMAPQGSIDIRRIGGIVRLDIGSEAGVHQVIVTQGQQVEVTAENEDAVATDRRSAVQDLVTIETHSAISRVWKIVHLSYSAFIGIPACQSLPNRSGCSQLQPPIFSVFTGQGCNPFGRLGFLLLCMGLEGMGWFTVARSLTSSASAETMKMMLK